MVSGESGSGQGSGATPAARRYEVEERGRLIGRREGRGVRSERMILDMLLSVCVYER